MGQFFEEIKRERIKTPTQKNFCLNKWNESWSKLKNTASERDEKIYKAGVIIDSLLSEIRVKLASAYKKEIPNITNEKLLMAYISLSNRDRAISSKSTTENVNLHSITSSKNKVGNEITLQEISDGAVDGVAKAIYFCKDRINKSKNLKCGSNPIDKLKFIEVESSLSQLYGMYESYWQAILWSDYELIELSKEEKIYVIKQPKNESEVGSLVSHIRKSRLGAQSAAISSSPRIQAFYEKNKYISMSKIGRKNKLKILTILNSDDEIAAYNSDWQTKKIFLTDEFNEDALKSEFENGFSIYDALEVFRHLMLLSIIYTRKYPEDDSVYNLNKLYEFCPRINKIDLCNAIKSATGFSFEKTRIILRFIEFKAGKNEDLWCHPLISISDKYYSILTSSLITPVIVRLVEHWLVSLGVELQDKGTTYEKVIIDNLNEALGKNKYISDFDNAVSRRIKVNGEEEEIDLLLRVGDLILVGEAKSIVTTDSDISQYRTIGTLKKASNQVIRKTKFLERNLKDVFDKLNWNYQCDYEYKFVRVIINSGRMYVGFNVDGVPVCDEKVLLRYFTSDTIPLLSSLDDKTKKEKHIAWVKLYKDISGLEGNLSLYLENPPQIFESESSFEYKRLRIPYIKNNSYKVMIDRLVPKDLSANDRLNIKTPFQIETVNNINEELEKVDFVI
ncbi:hypothetical protein [Vibrio splendidus]|uniref:hypothetical protein n=1 Tax=Vibrio splendidus TaxID=29497 RepID=UPI002468A6BE|nr:hypothetical protein [Vibrio splendidus]MDH5898123.1 hypothetical protein [Vibrio splendidus]